LRLFTAVFRVFGPEVVHSKVVLVSVFVFNHAVFDLVATFKFLVCPWLLGPKCLLEPLFDLCRDLMLYWLLTFARRLFRLLGSGGTTLTLPLLIQWLVGDPFEDHGVLNRRLFYRDQASHVLGGG
jgi:hypothetical protein